MRTCALMCVIGWTAAATFGWLALAAPQSEPTGLMLLNMTMAALGAAVGIWSWLRIRRATC